MLVSQDGVGPSRKVGVSASVNLALHHKVQKFSSGTGSLGWSRKKGRKTVVVVVHLPTCTVFQANPERRRAQKKLAEEVTLLVHGGDGFFCCFCHFF